MGQPVINMRLAEALTGRAPLAYAFSISALRLSRCAMRPHVSNIKPAPSSVLYISKPRAIGGLLFCSSISVNRAALSSLRSLAAVLSASSVIVISNVLSMYSLKRLISFVHS